MIVFTVDDMGIAELKLDRLGGGANMVSDRFVDDLIQAIDAIAADPDIEGVVVLSEQRHFCLGLDLPELSACLAAGLTVPELATAAGRFGAALRKMEMIGKPVVAAITGDVRGAGLELALACHARIVADLPALRLGFDGIAVGLMPGAGGTQRLVRQIGVAAALPLLLEEKLMSPGDALEFGLVDALMPAGEVVMTAKQKVRDLAGALQPWDRKAFEIPGGAAPGDPVNGDLYNRAVTDWVRKTMGNCPAHLAIIDSIARGAPLPIDKGLRIEQQNFIKLLREPACRNSIHVLAVDKQAIGAGYSVSQPAPVRVGVVGAGRMGAGIAEVAAAAGFQVTLTDISEDIAIHRRDALEAGLTRRLGPESAAVIAARIDVDPRGLVDCDLVIEAVFEEQNLKMEVLATIEKMTRPGTLIATNTSYIPIGVLAAASHRPSDFVGMHFFSPVPHMQLVEIIAGPATSNSSLSRAVGFVLQLEKTPIVVKDGRGFYTSRCFSSFMNEGMYLLDEGIAPALIENAARRAGMPMGPLAIADAVTLDLACSIKEGEKQALGANFVEDASARVPRLFANDLNRRGRPFGSGFYDYDAKGLKQLWPGLADHFPRRASQPTVRDVEDRLLYIQVVEAIKCWNEAIITCRRDADVGSVLGWGFPAAKGGALSFVDTIGREAFLKRCGELAKAYGERFLPPAIPDWRD